MTFRQNKENEFIEKDIHCPYCDTNQAVLISKTISKKISIQLPAYGLRFILSLLYLSFLHIWRYGYKLIEAIKVIDNITYVFCPNCGNSYSMAPPEVIKEETEEPKFYRIREGRICMGLCKGISEYTGISVLWIRIMTIFYGLTVIGAILYFLIGACIPFKENAEQGLYREKFYRIAKGKDIMGLCKGFSVYTDIPVGWVRLITVIFSPIMVLPYFIISAFVPVKEKVEQGIVRKKLYKIKEDKVFFGLCSGFSERFGMPRWFWRILGVLLFIVYLILSAVIPTKEE